MFRPFRWAMLITNDRHIHCLQVCSSMWLRIHVYFVSTRRCVYRNICFFDTLLVQLCYWNVEVFDSWFYFVLFDLRYHCIIVFICRSWLTNRWSQRSFESSELYHSFDYHEVCLNFCSVRTISEIILFLRPRECNSVLFMDETFYWSSVCHISRKIRVCSHFIPWVFFYLVQIHDVSFTFCTMHRQFICFHIFPWINDRYIWMVK